MKSARALSVDEPQRLPPVPGWAMFDPGADSDTAAFQAGAALAHLVVVASTPDLPLALWRDRLALSAAEACVAMTGRREGQGALRDAVCLTRPGDDLGPSGRVLRQWSRAVTRPLTVAGLVPVLEGVTPAQIGLCLGAQGPTPVHRAAAVLEAALTDSPRSEVAALILADAVLSKALGQGHILPLLALALRARDLRLEGDALRLACHRAIVAGARTAVPLAADLTRRAARLRAVLPQLRAKASARAVGLFLARDALAPSAFDFMSDRAARRLCDRLVALGAVRELTGRDSFRLYGV